MPYRTGADAPRDEAPPPSTDATCARCLVPIPAGEDRCPKCLRRSTVIRRGDAPPGVVARASHASRAGHGGALEPPMPTVWPYGDRCPICAERPVADATFFLRISKVASGFGTVTTSLIARCRCCEPCGRRVARFEQLRYGAAVAVVLGLMATALFFLPGWLRVFGLIGSALGLAAGIAFVRENRALRAVLDRAEICDRLSETFPAPSGLVEYELRVVHAKVSAPRKSVDLREVLPGASPYGPATSE